MKPAKKLLMLALVAPATAPALAQQPAPCVATDPPFLAEGPLASAIASGFAGTLSSMGVTITVPEWARVSTPTAELDMPRFAATTPFPGRFDDAPANTAPTPGFINGTVIAEGCVKLDPTGGTNHLYVAEDVFSDVNENVLLGVVTEAPSVDEGNGAVRFAVLGTPVSMLQDPRMPAHPLANEFGLAVDPGTVPVGAPASVEGYFGADEVLHAFTAEVAGGTLADTVSPQISIQRYRCSGDLRLQGGIFLGAESNGSCTFTRPQYSMRLFNVEGGQQIAFDSNSTSILDVQQGVAPDQAFCSYNLRFEPPACPANVRIELLKDGVLIAAASTTSQVPGANAAPVASADNYSTPFGTTLEVLTPGLLANDTDADGDPLTAVLVSDAVNGELEFGDGDGSFVYTPEAGFSGIDTFTYRAVDSKGAISNVVTVTIVVGDEPPPAPIPPVAANDFASLAHATAAVPRQVTIDVLANDTANGGPLVIDGFTTPANGTIQLVNNQFVFTPNDNFLGTTSFTYTARNETTGLTSNAATVSVTTTNSAPTAVNDGASTQAGVAVTIPVLANDSDPEGDALIVGGNLALTSGEGTLVRSGDNQAVIYTPAPGFTGTASFTYQAVDSFGLVSGFATGTVEVQAPATVVDLDIQQLRTTNNVRTLQAVAISLVVRNSGSVDEARPATIVGMQNGEEVYRRTVSVSDPVGGGTTVNNFPSFTPTRPGVITWTAEIFDDDPDIDVATATTTVR